MFKTDKIEIEAADLVKMVPFVAGVVYKCVEGAQFKYVMPCFTGDFIIADCVPCNKHGQPIGVPIYASDLLEPIFED